jgi:hypothetical protein
MRIHGNIADGIRNKRFLWHGHVRRTEQGRLPKQVLEGQAEGWRRRGRPTMTWKEDNREGRVRERTS